MFTNATNANAFHIGQTVIADGRTATYAGTHANGTHYVYTIAGLVPARHVIDATCPGAPRQLQSGAPSHRRAHVSLAHRPIPRVIPLRRLAA